MWQYIIFVKPMRTKVGSIILACIILLLGVEATSATDSDLFTSGNITLRLLNVEDESDDRIEVRYGNTINIRVVYPLPPALFSIWI